MKKIVELIGHEPQLSYSFEVTPQISEDELSKVPSDPLFYSVTWHSKGHRCKCLDIDSLRTASLLRNKEKHVLLHISCDMMTADYLNQLLNLLQEKDICNLFIVLGEGYDSSASDFTSTAQMIKYIREKTGQYFCIGIAAFPGCSDEKLAQTKFKVDCGADFMITQALFGVNEYAQLKERCDKIGINIPIVPGIFPFESRKQLDSFIKLCKIKVSDNMLQNIENMVKLNKPCEKITIQLIHDMNTQFHVKHFHFFTLNKFQNVCQLVQQLK